MKFSTIIFPKDEGKHNTPCEWWYFNGFLESENKKFAYMTTLFRVNAREYGIFRYLPKFLKSRFVDYYFSHSIIIDLDAKKTNKNISYFALVSKESFRKQGLNVSYKLLFNNENNVEIEETGNKEYTIKSDNLDLVLRSVKKPLLENQDGYFSSGKYFTYYYSLSDIETYGKIKFDNKYYDVYGKTWHDHQWMNKIYDKDIWDWFSFNLDNQDIVCFRHKEKNSKEWTYIATRIKDNKLESTNKLEFKELKTYLSKYSNISYPTEWEIIIPEWNINLKTKTYVDDLEMRFLNIKYFEGPIRVQGVENNNKIFGKGFCELIGRKL